MTNPAQQILQDALYFHQIGDYENARASYHTFLAHYPEKITSEVYHYLANIYFRLHDYSAAFNYSQEALKKEPLRTEILYNHALILQKLNRCDEACNTFKQILSIQPNNTATLHQLGNLMMQQNDLLSARDYYHQLIALHTNDFFGWYNLAMCYLRLNEKLIALDYLNQAQSIKPNDLDCLYNLGVLHLEFNNYEKAIDYFQLLLTINPEHLASLVNLAVVFIRQQNPQSALPYIKRGLALQPHQPTLLFLQSVFSNHPPPAQAPNDYLIELFDYYAEHYDQHLHLHLNYQLPQQIHDVVVSLPNVALARVIDLGCGTGLCGEKLRPLVKQLTGVDLSVNMLAQARQKNCYDELIHTDILNYLSTQPAAFTLMLAADVVVYQGDLAEFLKHCYHALAHQGYVIFNYELSKHYPYQLDNTARYSHHPNYIKTLLQQTGFQLRQCTSIIPRLQQAQAVKCHLILAQKKATF
ncbi:MAG: tetratricopeptide repeat protein [Legionellales bacterium]|nr:tetratricopeptide repeat protein [Legionellales bacterium]